MNFGALVNTVQRNCNISDARYAGNYTMCIFLLKMREFFRWEYDIPYSCDLPKDEVGNWLVEREQVWEGLETKDYAPLPLGDNDTDPFDADSINLELEPRGYIYSSGYGIYAKPLFFLGELSRKLVRDGINIYISSCEYARDLVAPPAMLAGNNIFVRQESVRRFVWEKIEEWRWKQQADTPMARAIDAYGGLDNIDQLLDHITEQETETMILHELGEIEAGRRLGPAWEQMLIDIDQPRLEHMLRAARDNYADSLSTLPTLINREAIPSLHFYFANLNGLRRSLFPEAMTVYQQWAEHQDISLLSELSKPGQQRWGDICQRILSCYHQGGPQEVAAMEQHLTGRLN